MGVDPAAAAIGAVAGAIAASLVQNGKLAGLLRRLGKRDASLEERSTTSSAGGGAAAYETRKAVDEYLQFHFGAASDILPYAAGPKVGQHTHVSSCINHMISQGLVAHCAAGWSVHIPNPCLPHKSQRTCGTSTGTTTACLGCLQNALEFTSRCALLCEKHCEATSDFTGG
jgi:hypothetical protein